MCSLPRSRGQVLAGPHLRAILEHCRAQLGIRQRLSSVPISRFQVTDERGRPGAGLIGVVFDARTATIYHTSALTPEDVVHELLHVAHPTWSEAAVVHATALRWRGLARSLVRREARAA